MVFPDHGHRYTHRLPWPCGLQAGAGGQGRKALSHVEVPLNVHGRRGPPGRAPGAQREGWPGVQDQGRPAYHAGGQVDPEALDRRVPAVCERAARRHVHRGAAPGASP